MKDTQELLKVLEGLLDDFKYYIADQGEEPQRAGYMKVAEDLINNRNSPTAEYLKKELTST